MKQNQIQKELDQSMQHDLDEVQCKNMIHKILQITSGEYNEDDQIQIIHNFIKNINEYKQFPLIINIVEQYIKYAVQHNQNQFYIVTNLDKNLNQEILVWLCDIYFDIDILLQLIRQQQDYNVRKTALKILSKNLRNNYTNTNKQNLIKLVDDFENQIEIITDTSMHLIIGQVNNIFSQQCNIVEHESEKTTLIKLIQTSLHCMTTSYNQIIRKYTLQQIVASKLVTYLCKDYHCIVNDVIDEEFVSYSFLPMLQESSVLELPKFQDTISIFKSIEQIQLLNKTPNQFYLIIDDIRKVTNDMQKPIHQMNSLYILLFQQYFPSYFKQIQHIAYEQLQILMLYKYLQKFDANKIVIQESIQQSYIYLFLINKITEQNKLDRFLINFNNINGNCRSILLKYFIEQCNKQNINWLDCLDKMSIIVNQPVIFNLSNTEINIKSVQQLSIITQLLDYNQHKQFVLKIDPTQILVADVIAQLSFQQLQILVDSISIQDIAKAYETDNGFHFQQLLIMKHCQLGQSEKVNHYINQIQTNKLNKCEMIQYLAISNIQLSCQQLDQLIQSYQYSNKYQMQYLINTILNNQQQIKIEQIISILQVITQKEITISKFEEIQYVCQLATLFNNFIENVDIQQQTLSKYYEIILNYYNNNYYYQHKIMQTILNINYKKIQFPSVAYIILDVMLVLLCHFNKYEHSTIEIDYLMQIDFLINENAEIINQDLIKHYYTFQQFEKIIENMNCVELLDIVFNITKNSNSLFNQIDKQNIYTYSEKTFVLNTSLYKKQISLCKIMRFISIKIRQQNPQYNDQFKTNIQQIIVCLQNTNWVKSTREIFEQTTVLLITSLQFNNQQQLISNILDFYKLDRKLQKTTVEISYLIIKLGVILFNLKNNNQSQQLFDDIIYYTIHSSHQLRNLCKHFILHLVNSKHQIEQYISSNLIQGLIKHQQHEQQLPKSQIDATYIYDIHLLINNINNNKFINIHYTTYQNIIKETNDQMIQNSTYYFNYNQQQQIIKDQNSAVSYFSEINKNYQLEKYVDNYYKQNDIEILTSELNNNLVSDINQIFDKLQEYSQQEQLEQNFQKKIQLEENETYQLENNLIVVATFVENMVNVGAIVRTCEIFNCQQLIVNDITVMKDQMFIKTAVTSQNHLNIIEVKNTNLQNWLINKKKQGYDIVCLEQSERSTYLQKVKLPNKLIMILGNEKKGVPDQFINMCDYCVEIPQFGSTRSLNVHVSCSLFVWEYAKQWMK